MVVLLHVIIALTSVAYTTGLFFRPSKRKLYTSYGLVGLTLASGTYLVVTTHAHMLQACTGGLIYIGVVLVGIIPAHVKLAHANNKTD